MEAMLYPVEGRTAKTAPGAPADFSLGAGRSAAVDTALEPGWSLYCLDLDRREALFVALSADVDLAEAPFMGAAQRAGAKLVLRVPLAALEGLAARNATPRRMIFNFSIGRCGTTLANAMLNRARGVWSLSEPDAVFDLVMRRSELDRGEAAALVAACARLMFRPPAHRSADTLGVKLRSQNLFHADLFHESFPDAAYFFMYREGEGWAASFYRFVQNVGMERVLNKADAAFGWWILSAAADPACLEGYVDMDADEIRHEQLFAVGWALHLDEYMRLHAGGIPFAAFRYDEFNRARERMAAALLAHCGLPASDLPAVLAAFAKDSQEGTPIARDREAEPISADGLARFRETLARHPRINKPDLILPGTVL